MSDDNLSDLVRYSTTSDIASTFYRALGKWEISDTATIENIQLALKSIRIRLLLLVDGDKKPSVSKHSTPISGCKAA